MTNIKNRGNYLVSLYFKTGSVYSLDRSKLEKLLIIESMCLQKNGIHPLDQLIYHSDTKTICLPSLFSLYFNRIVKGCTIENGIVDRIPNESIEPPVLYREIGDITLEEKELLNCIFFKFGNTKLCDLRNNINEIFNQMYCLADQNEEIKVGTNDIYHFFKENNMDEKVKVIIK